MRKNRMKYISQKFLKGVVIFVAFLLLINQHAKGIIGDAGKPRPDLKQSLLQDVGNC
jgi:hypothetical protein